MIPRTFHHIWPGYDEIPPSVMRMRDSWVSHHPDWEFRLWRPADLGWLRHQALFERAESYAQKADIARFEVIERYGGVYLDTDMECLRPIDPLLEGLDFFAGREPHGPVCASIFGAVPGFRLLRDVIASLPVSCLVHRRLNVQTGPALLTDVVDRGEWERRPTVRIFAAPFFYPYDWSEPWRRGTRFPTAFAVHHWSHSWKDQDGVRPLISELRPTTLSAAATEVSALIAAGRAGLRHKARASIVTPLKRAARRYVERAISTQPRAVPLGDGTILVSGPLNIRLLCPAGDLSLTPELALDGTYGPDFVEFLRRALRPGMTVVDVGANLGIYTLVAARLGCRVHAYECNPEMVDLLERNVAMNWLDDRVVVVRKAAGRLDEPIRFHAPREMRGLGSTAQPLEGRTSRPQSSEITVESERLDVGLAKLGFIDLLKIDVEGGETDVLAGAASLLAERRVGMIALEYRLDAVDDLHRTEMEVRLRWLAEGLGARFHLPSRPSPLRLDEVLATAQYPNLLVRFPWSSISLTPSGRD
jgi:FkbM family methyltransferase